MNYEAPTHYEDPAALAKEYQMDHPLLSLKLRTIMIFLGLVIAGAADIGSVCFVMKQRYIDAMGNFSGNYLELLGISAMTLVGYVLISILWQAGHRRAGGALYLVIVALLTLCLWGTETPKFQEIWGGSSSHAGGVFAAQPDEGASSEAPLWFLAACNVLLAACFSLSGLLFIYLKQRLTRAMDDWNHQLTAERILASHDAIPALEKTVQQHAALHDSLKDAGARERMIRQARRLATNQCRATVQARRNAAEALLADVTASSQTKRQAEDHVARADRFLAVLDRMPANPAGKGTGFVMALLLALFMGSASSRAATTADICATAPVFELLVDVSGSSPARDAGFIREALPLIEQKLRTMPACSTVLVATVGDAAQMPVTMRTRIQMRTTKDGATVNDIAQGMRQWLANFPKRIGDHPQGRSELIGAFADAERNFNPHANGANVIVMLSDLVEHSALADCERPGACRLPIPKFTLANAEVTVYGAGLGLSSSRAMALEKAWDHFFIQAGAKADLRRTF